MTADEFGVPESLLGPVPEDEYRLVGRIVTVAPLVEVTLYDFVTELKQAPQNRYAGESAAALLKQAETALNAGAFRQDYVDLARPVLAKLQEAFELRNAVVHGVRPAQPSGPGLAWRPARPKQRSDPSTPIVAVRVTLADLSALVLELVALQAQLSDLRVRSYGARLPLP